MDTTALRDAYRALLDAATLPASAPPPGEWTAEQILAHVTVVNAITLAAVAGVASGANPTYDNRTAHDPSTLQRIISVTGGAAGLRERIRLQGDALCTLAGTGLSDTELDTLVPALLISHNAVLVNQPMPLRDLIAGLAAAELPGHTLQLGSLQSAATVSR
jgi:hypothetical protein